jgi:C-terminal processing protease CtpA/Prc
VEQQGIVEEAIWLMRKHFFRSFSEDTWNRLKSEISHISDPSAALGVFMSKFGCPYTRFIPEDGMTSRQRSIRGEMGTTGIELERRWIPPGELMKNFAEGWVAMITTTPAGSSNDDRIPFWTKAVRQPSLWLGGLKLLFDTASPIAVATMVHRTQQQGSKATVTATATATSSLARLLTVPVVCRALYAACVLFAIVTTTCRIAAIARPMHVVSLTTSPETKFSSSSSPLGLGLERGDVISHVAGHPVRSYWSSRAVLRKLNDGEVGSALSVTARRRRQARPAGTKKKEVEEGGARKDSGAAAFERPRTVIVERFAETICNVRADLLPVSQGSAVGYMSIREFSEKTREEVSDALLRVRQQANERDNSPLQALVIDLRGNPGGPIGSAFDVAAMFLGSGTVLSRTCTHRDRHSVVGGVLDRFLRINNKDKGKGEDSTAQIEEGALMVPRQESSDDPARLKELLRSSETHRSLNKRPDERTKLLLLMDGSTASASEIMIAALSCHSRAVTMGSTTKGKNVAQALVQMSDGSGLAFTIREYLDPLGGYMGGGVTPEINTRGLGVGERDLVDCITHMGGNSWSINGARSNQESKGYHKC